MPNELLQENWTFEPPVPEQFRIERSHDNRIETDFPDFTKLLPALFQKVNCMLRRCSLGCHSIIKLLPITAPCDPMIFYSAKLSCTACDGSQMFHWQIKTDVAIKFAVSWIAGVAFLRPPHLAAGLRIPCEGGRTRWRITRSINGAARTRRSAQ